MLVKATDKWVIIMTPIYRVRIVIAPTDGTVEDLEGSTVQTAKLEPPEPGNLGECEWVPFGKSGAQAVLMRIPRKYDESTVWHECIHAAKMILSHVGVETDDEGDESIPYVTEWIVKLVKKHYYGMAVNFDD